MALIPVDAARGTLLGLPAGKGPASVVVWGCDGPGGGLAERLRRRRPLGPAHPVHRIDLLQALDGADGGSCEPDHISPATMHVVGTGAVPVVVGGWPVPTPQVLRALTPGTPPYLLHLGAHVDGGASAPLRSAPDGVAVAGAIQFGVRSSMPSLDFDAPSRRDGHTLWSPDDLSDRGPDALAEATRNAVGSGPVFLSIELDVFDPAYAPGVPEPVPGGPSPREVFRFMRNLAGSRVVGATLGGAGDSGDPLTDALAEQVLFEVLALLALRSKDGT